MKLLPKRWYLYTVDLEPRKGTKPGKQRPCLVVQPSEFAEAGLDSSVILPLTSKITGKDAFPLRVTLPAGTCGLDKESEVMIDQILAWDHSLFRKELGILPEIFQSEIKKALSEFLCLAD